MNEVVRSKRKSLWVAYMYVFHEMSSSVIVVSVAASRVAINKHRLTKKILTAMQ